MMLYYRSSRGPRELPVHLVRALSIASLVAYPTGALVLATGDGAPITLMVGYALIAVALFAFVPLIGSSIQRVVGDELTTLDEFELRLRGKALSLSYAIFTALTLLAIMYTAVASDKGGWVPAGYQAYSGVFWGIFLYASVLPTAVLSWLVEPSFTGE